MADTKSETEAAAAIEINGLQFKYSKKPVLKGIDWTLKRGARCLLVGDNGAGKTTLLRILGGKHHVPEAMVKILGHSTCFAPELNVLRSYLGGNWGKRTVAFVGYQCPMSADIEVQNLMSHLQKQFPERREKLYKLLDIDPEWNMSYVSDGQRRRVQIMLGLLRPFELLLLDEITTDLDVCTRIDLLEFLREETEERGVSIVYATHIFDGLDQWPTDVLCVHKGQVQKAGSYADVVGEGRLMLKVASWIREGRAQCAAEAAAAGAASNATSGTKRPLIITDGTAGGFSSGRLAGMKI